MSVAHLIHASFGINSVKLEFVLIGKAITIRYSVSVCFSFGYCT